VGDTLGRGSEHERVEDSLSLSLSSLCLSHLSFPPSLSPLYFSLLPLLCAPFLSDARFISLVSERKEAHTRKACHFSRFRQVICSGPRCWPAPNLSKEWPLPIADRRSIYFAHGRRMAHTGGEWRPGEVLGERAKSGGLGWSPWCIAD
jgi:hypothetical protein